MKNNPVCVCGGYLTSSSDRSDWVLSSSILVDTLALLLKYNASCVVENCSLILYNTWVGSSICLCVCEEVCLGCDMFN